MNIPFHRIGKYAKKKPEMKMEKINEKFKLTELQESIEDTRRTRSVMHPLTEVLFIMHVAILSGTTSYVNFEMFGKQRQEWFQKHLKLENGVPDALTYRRVLMMITYRFCRYFASFILSEERLIE